MALPEVAIQAALQCSFKSGEQITCCFSEYGLLIWLCAAQRESGGHHSVTQKVRPSENLIMIVTDRHLELDL